MTDNPFFDAFDTPFGVPPFDRILEEHFMPAFEEGIRQQRIEAEAIAAAPSRPTFDNTVAALEHSGELLRRVSRVFFNLRSAHSTDGLEAIAREIAPRLAELGDDIWLDPRLLERVTAVQEQENSALSDEQSRLLDEMTRDFHRGGAGLDAAGKSQLREIHRQLAILSVEFGHHLRQETHAFGLVIDDPESLAGLPPSSRQAAYELAAERGHAGNWLFTLDKPSLIPFLQHSEKRDLRRRMLTAYSQRGSNDNEHDNNAIASRISALRARRAQLLSYRSHAHFVLEKSMAETPEAVHEFLYSLWQPAVRKAKQEAAELQAQIDAEGGGFKLQPWDWWFYAERVRRSKYDLEDAALKPYFELSRVRAGAFDVAHRLFGLRFEQRDNLPLYHPEVKAYEVFDRDDTHLGVLFTDDHPREGKRDGAWMNNYRDQEIRHGEDIRPVITNVCNLPRPTAKGPALLSLDEVTTVFHEFGHALHGLLTRCRYARLSGTSVCRDFVELPSQVMENWALDPEVLPTYARHYETDEPIPSELIEKIVRTEHFNQGFATVEYLAASFLDLAWHSLKDDRERETRKFEDDVLKDIGLISEILPRYRSTNFHHIFAAGYSAGYYSYIWAEVLDADTFHAFKSVDLFSVELAESLRRNILEKGNTEPPATLYQRFRGREPEVAPLLQRRGLNGV